jgi:exopolysaccharide biosynthesis polyprenyl glycosylphosphotransferase
MSQQERVTIHEPLTGVPEAHGNGHARLLEVSPEPGPPIPDWPLRGGSFRRDRLRRWGLALADVLALCSGYVTVWAATGRPQPLVAKLVLLAALPFWVLLNKLLGLYDRDANVINKSTLDELPRILQSVVLGSSLVFLAGPLFPGLQAGRLQAVVFMAVAAVTMPLLRIAARQSMDRRGVAERCLILGSGAVAAQLARKLAEHPGYGVSLVGYVDDAAPSHDLGPAPGSLGSVADFEQLCADLRVERVVIAFSTLSDDDLLAVLQTCKRLGVKVSIVPRLFEAIGDAVEVDQVEGMTLLGLRGLDRTRSSLALKRSIDVLGAGLGLVLLSPLLVSITIAVALESRGPVLFVQQRIGRRNRPFRMYKFRTMHDGADGLRGSLMHLNEAAEPLFKIANDPRLTRVGRRLRRFSLDELPQLWNVLRGEMSLVGPRPLIPDEDNHIMGPHRARLDLTPGLTGPWQVLSGRNDISFAEMVKLDFLYVADWSLWNDVKLLLRTAPVVITGRGR